MSDPYRRRKLQFTTEEVREIADALRSNDEQGQLDLAEDLDIRAATMESANRLLDELREHPWP